MEYDHSTGINMKLVKSIVNHTRYQRSSQRKWKSAWREGIAVAGDTRPGERAVLCKAVVQEAVEIILVLVDI